MTALAYVLLGFAALNGWICWMNVKKAAALDELADEVLRDRERNIQFAVANAENAEEIARLAQGLGRDRDALEQDRAGLSAFVALNPIARLKSLAES